MACKADFTFSENANGDVELQFQNGGNNGTPLTDDKSGVILNEPNPGQGEDIVPTYQQNLYYVTDIIDNNTTKSVSTGLYTYISYPIIDYTVNHAYYYKDISYPPSGAQVTEVYDRNYKVNQASPQFIKYNDNGTYIFAELIDVDLNLPQSGTPTTWNDLAASQFYGTILINDPTQLSPAPGDTDPLMVALKDGNANMLWVKVKDNCYYTANCGGSYTVCVSPGEFNLPKKTWSFTNYSSSPDPSRTIYTSGTYFEYLYFASQHNPNDPAIYGNYDYAEVDMNGVIVYFEIIDVLQCH
jgi:hypothetical protein